MAYPDPLQLSGPISMNDIAQWMLAAGEILSATNVTLASLKAASHLTNKAAPHHVSEWYGYALIKPACPDRVLVIEICNSNSSRDDNFDIYLNNVFIGAVNLNTDAKVGSVFIASLVTPEVTSADFVCPVDGMVHYYFNPNLILGGSNTLNMVNTQNNNNGNFGDVGIRNYLIDVNALSNPCVVADLTYRGDSGSNFSLSFTYDACCKS